MDPHAKVHTISQIILSGRTTTHIYNYSLQTITIIEIRKSDKITCSTIYKYSEDQDSAPEATPHSTSKLVSGQAGMEIDDVFMGWVQTAAVLLAFPVRLITASERKGQETAMVLRRRATQVPRLCAQTCKCNIC